MKFERAFDGILSFSKTDLIVMGIIMFPESKKY
jgi:hypothetical protein